ncbi:MAG: serine/threonine-protein phosphatase [Verrucomicrobia bacterium]|nr:serine/threonine-protein phosphatase [Verrucomicrobiota bacterium]
MPEGDLGLVVSDVSGHGMGAALIMAETRAYLRIVAFNRGDAGMVLTRAGQVLAEDLEDSGRFVTSLLVRLDPGLRQLRYANAGHTPGYLLDRTGRLRHSLARCGPALGVDSEAVYPESEPLELESGDLVLLTTDGVEEAESPAGEGFGESRLLEVVRASQAGCARDIIAAVRTALTDFCGGAPQQDDITLVVAKVL